jgi:Helix-turn-helix
VGYSIEVFNAVGDTVAVTVVDEDAIEALQSDEVLCYSDSLERPSPATGLFPDHWADLASGELTRRLNLLDPYKIWTWDPRSRQAFRAIPRSSFAQGITQRDLARRLSVHETQVSRDERNEYFGITLERAAKILDALNVRLRTQVAIDPLPPFPVAQAS